MFEVIVDGLRYIRDVPLELTEAAILSGALVKGAVVGLMVHSPGEPEKSVLVDVKLTDDGQEALLKPGQAVYLEVFSGIHRFPAGWRELLAPCKDSCTEDEPDKVEKHTKRPHPSHF